MRPKSLSGLLNWFSCKIHSIPVCTSPVPSSFSKILTVYEENIDLYIQEEYIYIFSLRNSAAKYVGNKMPRQFHNFPVCLGNASAKHIAEDSVETFLYYVGNGFGLGILPKSMIWFFNSWEYLFYLNYIIYL